MESVDYKVHIHQYTFSKVTTYKQSLEQNVDQAGTFLKEQLAGKQVSELSSEAFLELLVNTKRPQIFAESGIYGDGRDWNQTELSILGDIGISVPVTIFDNGLHTNPKVHKPTFPGTLLFVPGALLRNDNRITPVDWEEVRQNEQIDPEAFLRLYERRLLPLLVYADHLSAQKGRKALITIPGIGCGQFAGKFRGSMGKYLEKALEALLNTHISLLPNIKAVYYDPYRECANQRLAYNHLIFLVRPLTQGNQNKPQLCAPEDYEEPEDDFSDCNLFSFVAWDHVSWPGNDFYLGHRITDDGVKAAATSSMTSMTGIEGKYDDQTNQYLPPDGYRNWKTVVQSNNLRIKVAGNLVITNPDQTTNDLT